MSLSLPRLPVSLFRHTGAPSSLHLCHRGHSTVSKVPTSNQEPASGRGPRRPPGRGGDLFVDSLGGAAVGTPPRSQCQALSPVNNTGGLHVRSGTEPTSRTRTDRCATGQHSTLLWTVTEGLCQVTRTPPAEEAVETPSCSPAGTALVPLKDTGVPGAPPSAHGGCSVPTRPRERLS